MLNRVRLPFYLSKPQYPAEEDIYLKGNGRRVVLKSIVSKVMDGRTDYMPWPTYPMILKTSSSHEEGAERQWAIATKEFIADKNFDR